jgi:uncharacterized protein
MHFEGAIEAQVPKDAFYSFITDPQKVISIMPDVIDSKVDDASHFWVKSNVGMAFARGTMSIKFEILPNPDSASAKVIGRGQGMQSSVDLTMEIALQEAGGLTKALWTADAKVGGLLASVGSRLIESAAEKYVRQITDNLKSRVPAS